ncbi:MAG: hypothetical protein KGL35_15835 [Bradyrhizobium sp.]|nr:hypothetical protein [Bradyrhizobium sp.]
MSNPWFRMYSEFLNDPKVQMLSETDQRRFIMVLCMRCSNGDVMLHDEAVAFQLRISNEEWASTKAVLVAKNLIGDDNKPIAWNKRQYASDTSNQRVAKHRAKKKQQCNVTVTPPDSEADTETDSERGSAKASQSDAQLSSAPLDNLADRLLKACNGALDNPVNCQGLLNLVVPQMWIAEGADLELDVIPTLEAAGKKHHGKRIRSWQYFNQMIADAKATRLAGLPSGTAAKSKKSAGYYRPTVSQLAEVLVELESERNV